MLLAVRRTIIAADEQAEFGIHRVVQLQTGGIERRGIGECYDSRRVVVPFVSSPCGERVGIQQRRDCGNGGRTHFNPGDELGTGKGNSKAQPLIGEEEEKLIAYDGATQSSAKVILLFCRLRQVSRSRKIVSRVEYLVP